MRILLVSFFFPPYNNIGALRVGKIARYLTQGGHDIRVIASANQPLQPTLPVEIPQEQVTYAPWLDVNRPVELALGGRQRVAANGYRSSRSMSGPMAGLFKTAGSVYKTLCNFPDGQIGWVPWATAAARHVTADWRPDVIYASAMPFSSLLVAASVARRLGIPWVGELRDLWVDHHAYSHPPWRRRVERRWEAHTLSRAAALVTVSEPLADRLRTLYGKPTAVIYNGFDPQDYPVASRTTSPDEPLRLVYTGMVYERFQDPTPLFQAIAKLGPLKERVRVAFYGRYVAHVKEQASRVGVEDQVEIHPPVPYCESLRLQVEADVLLLLLWNDRKESGIYSGKLYEYLGARRPILAVGPGDDLPAKLIRDRQAGVVMNDPPQIAAQLSTWITEKKSSQGIPPTEAEDVSDLTRESQTRQLEEFLHQVVLPARRAA